MSAQRIQRKRVKGWKMPPNTVMVSRPSKWGNPYQVASGDKGLDAKLHEVVVEQFRQYVQRPENRHFRKAIAKELRGKNLACWCAPDKPCHADVLLEIANA